LVPIDRTIGAVNLEQMGRTDGPQGREISSATLTGFNFTTLTNVFRRAADLTGIRMYDDPRSRAYFRYSDNLSFAQQGVPSQTMGVLYEFPDYHDVGDTMDKIDFDNMARVDRMLAIGVYMIANDSRPPRWNESLQETTPYVQALQSRDRH